MKSKLVSVLSLFFVVLASAVPAPAQQASSNPTVIPPVSYDISPPLVDLVASRSEERRVGKECRCGVGLQHGIDEVSAHVLRFVAATPEESDADGRLTVSL